jgi:hypothetical protein
VSDLPPSSFANYPRPQYGGAPSGEFSRPPGVYFEAIGDAWRIITQDLWNWVAITMIAWILIILLSIPGSIAASLVQNGGQLLSTDPPTLANTLLSIPVNIVGGALVYPAVGGYLWAALKRVRGEEAQIGDLFYGFQHFVPLVLYGILYSVLTVVGLLLLIVPGIYVIGAITFSPLLIMDKNLGPVQAIGASMRTLGSNAWLMFGFLFVSGILAGLGVFACCVGALVSAPIYVIGIALHYHYHFDGQAPQSYAPPAHVG